MKFVFSIYHSTATAGTVAIIVTAIIMGGGAFISPPAILFVLGIPFFLLLGSYKGDFLLFIPDSLKALFMIPLESNPRYVQIAHSGARYVMGAGIVGALIGIIQLLQNVSDPTSIGCGMAASFFTIFYALLLSEFYYAFLSHVFADRPTHPLPLSTLGKAVGVTVFILTISLMMLICFL